FQSGFPRGRALVAGSLLVVSDAEGRVRALAADGTARGAPIRVRRGEVFLALHRDQQSVWLIDDRELWHWDPGTGAREGPFAHEYGDANPPISIAHLQSDRLLMATGYEILPRMLDLER